jgi:hypothetical protein
MFIFLGFSLPIFVIAATLSNLSEAVICGVAIVVASSGLLALITAFNGGGPPNRNMPVLNTGEQWILDSARTAIVLLIGFAILQLQYFKRRTMASRVLTGVATVAWTAGFFLPWSPAFALEKRLSPVPGAADHVGVALETDGGRARISPERVRAAKARYSDEIFYVPVHLTGLSPDRTVIYDRISPTLTLPDGKVVTLNHGNEIELHRQEAGGSDLRGNEGFFVPRDLYFRVKDKPARLEVNYSLTLHELQASYAFPALDGSQRMPGIGACHSQLDEDGDEIELKCVQAGSAPACASVFLENSRTGERNPPMTVCNPEYAPYFGKFLFDDMSRFGTDLRFADPSGLTKFPVGEKQLNDARVVMRLYRPTEHFTRKVILENLRMSDWEPLP